MGGEKELETQEIPLMSPEQQKMLNRLLSGTMAAMKGYPLGQAYGGPVESSWQTKPFMGEQIRRDVGGGPTGGPIGRRPGPGFGRSMFGGRGIPSIEELKQRIIPGEPQTPGGEGVQKNANFMAELLAGPMVNPMTQAMTGNFPSRRMA